MLIRAASLNSSRDSMSCRISGCRWWSRRALGPTFFLDPSAIYSCQSQKALFIAMIPCSFNPQNGKNPPAGPTQMTTRKVQCRIIYWFNGPNNESYFPIPQPPYGKTLQVGIEISYPNSATKYPFCSKKKSTRKATKLLCGGESKRIKTYRLDVRLTEKSHKMWIRSD